MKKRLIWADILRILAIYLVLVLHSTNLPLSFSINFLPILIINSLSSTCVPIFVMLSGALLLPKKENYLLFFRKRFSRIILPWFFWTIIFITVYNREGLLSLFKVIQIFSTVFHSFWFLPMISGLYLLTPSIRIFVQTAKRKDIIFIIFLWFFSLSFLPFHHNSLGFPLIVDDGLVRQIVEYCGYFLLGYLIRQIKPIKNEVNLSLILILLGIFWTVFNVINSSTAYFYKYIAPGIVVLSSGIFILIFSLEDKLQKYLDIRGTRILSTLSGASLGIYFVHPLVQNFLRKIIGRVNIFNSGFFLDGIINGTFLFVLSFLVIFLLQQIRFLKKLVA